MSRAALCVLFAFAALPLSAHAGDQSAVGSWSGALHQGEAAYRVKFQVQSTPDGRLTGTVTGLPGDGYTAVPATVRAARDGLVIDAAGGRYNGVWDEAKGAWVGSWRQAEMSEPLILRWETDNAVRVQRSRTEPPPVPTQRQTVTGEGAMILAPPKP